MCAFFNQSEFAFSCKLHGIKTKNEFEIRVFAKLNGREKNILANSRKLIPTRHGFFFVIFGLLGHKNRLFSSFYLCFCMGKSNFAKINSRKMNSSC